MHKSRCDEKNSSFPEIPERRLFFSSDNKNYIIIPVPLSLASDTCTCITSVIICNSIAADKQVRVVKQLPPSFPAGLTAVAVVSRPDSVSQSLSQSTTDRRNSSRVRQTLLSSHHVLRPVPHPSVCAMPRCPHAGQRTGRRVERQDPGSDGERTPDARVPGREYSLSVFSVVSSGAGHARLTQRLPGNACHQIVSKIVITSSKIPFSLL